MLNDENMVRLEEAKQILCKVVLVIVALAYATRSLKANAAVRNSSA